MKIVEFSFENKKLNWRIEKFLLSNLTLLVGASGVGKTQTLKALMRLKEIASGESFNGVKWYVRFTTLSNNTYQWEGEFETKEDIGFFDLNVKEEDFKGENSPQILYEKIIRNDEIIVDRQQNQILFKGEPTIKLSQQESVMHLLKEEELIKSAYHAINRMEMIDHSDSTMMNLRVNQILLMSKSALKKYTSAKQIQESDLPIVAKLFLIQKADEKLFDSIKERFIDIFPQIKDVKIAPIKEQDEELPDFLKDYPFIQIKEKGVDHWIGQERISSGMFRTLMQLSELYLCAEGTVFLIDEFENSLGINCINEITNDILNSDRQLQFILTSHHPYIIDAIDYTHWKLVTRNKGVVYVNDITKYKLGKSRHSAFMQLLQLEEYQTGLIQD